MIANIEHLFNLNNSIFDKKEIRQLLQEISVIAGYLWKKGWAERNAGNFSINITGLFSQKDLDKLSLYPFFPLQKEYLDLSRQLFLISRTGSRMRDIALDPLSQCCFIFIGETGTAFHIIYEESGDEIPKPTTELPAHLSIQQLLIQQKSPDRVVLHSHVLELIALTHLSRFKSEEELNKLFWGMHPETLYFLPEGAGFIPFAIPGTEYLAQATVKSFENHKVIIWEKHGCLAVAPSISEAFDILDILAKAARIYFYCKNSGQDPEGLDPKEIEDLRTHYSGLF